MQLKMEKHSKQKFITVKTAIMETSTLKNSLGE